MLTSASPDFVDVVLLVMLDEAVVLDVVVTVVDAFVSIAFSSRGEHCGLELQLKGDEEGAEAAFLGEFDDERGLRDVI